jgi:hypothetical protein
MCDRNHDDLKRDEILWRRQPYVGVQRVDIPGQQSYALELRNCASCMSTLARLIPGIPIKAA